MDLRVDIGALDYEERERRHRRRRRLVCESSPHMDNGGCCIPMWRAWPCGLEVVLILRDLFFE